MNNNMIYLDNAATTYVKPKTVIEAVVDAMQTGGNAGRGGHSVSLLTSRVIYETRQDLLDFFGFDDLDNIAFTANATESLNIAIQGILNEGDHVITTFLEHNSVLRPIYMMEEKGVEASFASCNDNGQLNYDEIEGLIKPNTKMIVVTHASNVTGNINNINKISKIAKEHDIIFILDASQTAGEIPINAKEMGIDVLCTTGHKGLMGPQGVGILGVRKGIDIRPLKVGGSGTQSFSKEHPKVMPTRLEAGTLNSHAISGIRAAIHFINDIGIEQISTVGQELMKNFYEGVKDIKGIKIYGDFKIKNRASIVSLNIGDIDSSEIADILAEEYGIAIRAGAHCAPLVHKYFGTEKQGMVRFSFGYFNTIEEVDKAICAVRNIAEELM